MNTYQEQAHEMIRILGYVNAKFMCIRNRDLNSPGTASYSYHNAVLKAIIQLGDETEGLRV